MCPDIINILCVVTSLMPFEHQWQAAGHVEKFNVVVFSDTVNIDVVNVELCMMLLLFELYLCIPLSVTLPGSQSYSGVKKVLTEYLMFLSCVILISVTHIQIHCGVHVCMCVCVCLCVHIILDVNCFDRTMLYMCIQYHIQVNMYHVDCALCVYTISYWG